MKKHTNLLDEIWTNDDNIPFFDTGFDWVVAGVALAAIIICGVIYLVAF